MSKNRITDMMTKKECNPFRNRHHFISTVSGLADDLMIEKKLLNRLVLSPARHYRSYYIKSSSGKFRMIEEPDYYFTIAQDRIYKNYLIRYPVSEYATAYHKGAKIADNAAPHVGKKYVLKMDLSDFFGHITDRMVFEKVFSKAPFSKDIAVMLTKLCTLNRKLPQGASTSPAISNLVMAEFDELIGKWCRKRKVSYTRYSDDLTFSSYESLIPVYHRAKRQLEKMGFEINEAKTRIIGSHNRQQVTGIVVNERINISAEYRRNLRQEVYYVLKYGAEDAYSRYIKKSNVSVTNIRSYILSLIGKSEYVLNVRKEDRFFREAKWYLRKELSLIDNNDLIRRKPETDKSEKIILESPRGTAVDDYYEKIEKIKKGVFLKKNGMLVDDVALDMILSAKETRSLPDEEEKELLRRSEEHDPDAILALQDFNLNLVVDEVLHFKGNGQIMSDVLRAGDAALLTSIFEYRSAVDKTFKEVAAETVRRSLDNARFSAKGDPFLPVKMKRQHKRIMEATDNIKGDLRSDISIEIISAKLDLPVQRIKHALEWYEKYGCILEEIGAEEGLFESTQETEEKYFRKPEYSDVEIDDLFD